MSKCIQRNIVFLQLLAKKRSKQRALILDKASYDNIKCLSEISHNLLKGNLKVSAKIIKKLKKFKDILRALGEKKTSLKTKKKLLLKSNSYLPYIINPVLSAVGTISGKIVANYMGI